MMSVLAKSVLLAMTSEARGQALSPLVRQLKLEPLVITDVKTLLYETREESPVALIVEQMLLNNQAKLDLIELLRKRKTLKDVPLIILGPNKASLQAAALTSGADAYFALPTQPGVILAGLSRLLDRHEMETALRETLVHLRQIEQQFKEAERVKDDLIHMLVHDLKSPIASVMGLLDHSLELLDQQAEASTAAELLSLARVEAQHLLHLAANILDVRRMTEGHMPYKPTRIEDLTVVAKQALQDVSGTPRERNFSFLIRPEAEVVFADPDLLRRILANLFANAIKHTRRNGYIDFRAVKQEDVFLLSVRDDGEGIPEQDQKRIFNAFEQSRHTVHDRFDTGMGLTFCKLAVEKHGGSIWVESKLGRGSTFYFTLPTNVEDFVKRQTLVEEGTLTL